MYVCDLTKLGVIHKTSVQRERGGYVQSGHGGGDVYAVVDVHKLYHYNNLCDSLLLLDIVIPRLTISLRPFHRLSGVATLRTAIHLLLTYLERKTGQFLAEYWLY